MLLRKGKKNKRYSVKKPSIAHFFVSQSRLTDAVSVIFGELLSYEHPPKDGGFIWRSRRDSLAVLPHRDSESGETLPVAEKVSRFRGSGTIDGTGQVASIVMPRRCRRALNAPLGRFFASLMPCSNLWIQKRTPPCWVVFFLAQQERFELSVRF